MGARYTEGRFGNGGVSPPMDREATPMDWRSRVPPWCSNPSAWREVVRGRLWRLRLKIATQVQKTWWVGLRLAQIEDWAKIRPRSPQNKVFCFLTSKPGEASGLLATWRTSKRGVEKKKIEESS
ncbi:hypothetical protein U9M48_008698 [Paspalum notatum var. saurae]|uniref:Uncharacterized protein n=1 Tax=Paspalum notatum var. saurae TaxID=547442 RepID=A0AAQ3WDR2_PASNO